MKIRDPHLKIFAEEIQRWNRQINLVSRQDTANLLEDLFLQCLGGAEALWSYLVDGGLVSNEGTGVSHYFDLGSGAGIPGVIWHQFFAEKDPGLQTCLVEPRAKRAWFLERIAGLPDSPSFSVFSGRWEEIPAVFAAPAGEPVIVISLKALHLPDPVVLGGVGGALSDPERGSVVVARFYPPGQVLDAALKKHLQVAAAGDSVRIGGREWEGRGPAILNWSAPASREAVLVLSRYRISGK